MCAVQNSLTLFGLGVNIGTFCQKNFNDIKEGDILEASIQQEVKR